MSNIIKKNSVHIFQKYDKQIIFFSKKVIFAEISEIAYNILKSQIWDKKSFYELSKHYKPNEIKECIKEIKILKRKGFFDPEKQFNQNQLSINYIINRQPSGIVLDIAQKCNFNCTYCYGTGGSYGSNIHFMSKAVAKAAINRLVKTSKDVKKFQIVFFGGEPFLNFSLIKYVVDICKRIEAREQKYFRFSVTTNGSILNNEIINFLKNNKFGVMVSFDGIKEIHNKYRPLKNGKGSFDIVIQNIKKLARHLPVTCRCTVVKEMISRNILAKIIKNAKLLRINNLILSPVDCSKIKNASYSLNADNLQELYHLFEEITENNFIKLINGTRTKIIFDPYCYLIRDFYKEKIFRRYKCGAFFGMRAVSTNGNIYPCHRFVGMDNFVIGNVFKGINYKKIMELLTDFDRSRYLVCKSCWLNKICGGPCYYYSANYNGTFNQPDETFCRIMRNNYETTLYFLVKYYNEIYEKPHTDIKATNHL